MGGVGCVLLKVENTSHNHHQNFMCGKLVSESPGNFNDTHEAVKATLKRRQNEWMSGEGGGRKKRGGLSFTVSNPW